MKCPQCNNDSIIFTTTNTGAVACCTNRKCFYSLHTTKDLDTTQNIQALISRKKIKNYGTIK